MPDDDIAARLRGLAEQMGDVVTIGHEDDPYFGGGDIADVEEAADLIDSLRADNARLTRQLAFDPAHARLTAAAVAIEDSGVLPEGCTLLPLDAGRLNYEWPDGSWLMLVPDDDGEWFARTGDADQWWAACSATDPVEAAVAAIAATTEGAS